MSAYVLGEISPDKVGFLLVWRVGPGQQSTLREQPRYPGGTPEEVARNFVHLVKQIAQQLNLQETITKMVVAVHAELGGKGFKPNPALWVAAGEVDFGELLRRAWGEGISITTPAAVFAAENGKQLGDYNPDTQVITGCSHYLR